MLGWQEYNDREQLMCAYQTCLQEPRYTHVATDLQRWWGLFTNVGDTVPMATILVCR